MKKLLSIISILAIVVLFDSCKKSSPTPTPSTPSAVTPTPTPTTTVVDTVGKVRVFFTASLIDVVTSPFDYKYDTLNTRIRLNQTYIHCGRTLHNGNLTALSIIPSTNIWMGSGDSLVVEFDSLEYNTSFNNPLNSLNGKLQITEQTFNTSGGAVYNNLTPIPLKDYTITGASSGIDHNLGLAYWFNSSTAQGSWCVGKRTKVVYIKP